MKHTSTLTVVSQIDSTVSYVLKRINQRKRDRIEEIKAPFEARIRPLREAEEYVSLAKDFRAALEASRAVGKEERAALLQSGSTAKEALEQVPYGTLDFPDERFTRYLELTSQIQKIDRAEMTPAVVDYVLVRIEGLEIMDADGNAIPPTLANLLADGPDEIYNELALAVAHELGLDPESRENLDSPYISAAPDRGAKSTGSADPVETPETIIAAAV